MADIRARLEAALREAISRHPAPLGYYGHIAEALLSTPGIAIVELPESEAGVWRVDDDFEVSTMELARVNDAWKDSPVKHAGCQITWGSVELNLVTNDARALAAALLATANAAEKAVS